MPSATYLFSKSVFNLEQGWVDLQVKVDVYPRILHLLPDLRTHHINLLLRVAQSTLEDDISESFETFHDLEEIPGPNFFL